MGNRSYIQVESKEFESPIVYYSHWTGEENLEAVRNVLARTNRIGDASYLAAQIFKEFAIELGGYDGDTGFGISAGTVSDGWADAPTVFVNADDGSYVYVDEENNEFAKKKSMA